jgi:tripartite-type tricarboxylate transporter receptor subunit TctC
MQKTQNPRAWCLSLLLLCLAALPTQAADYPAHAIKMVVPFAPGGGTDVLGRIIGQKLSEQWGQPVIVENQPGASGGVGTRAAAKAEPDGYTLLMASTGALMAVSAALAPEGHFDVNKFFAPITVVAAPPYLLVINPQVQANTTAELIKLAREKPKALSFGSSGIGAASHLSGALFEKDAHIEMLHVPYKGTGPAVTDLLGGRIDMMFSPSTTVQAFVEAGKLKALATTGAKRSKFFPNIPTVAESGLPATHRSAGSVCWRPRTRPKTSSTKSTRRWSRSWRCRTSSTTWRNWAPSRSRKRRRNSAATSMPMWLSGTRW